MSDTLPIYPPTRTDTYDRCPLLDELSNKERWVPRQATKLLVGGLAGRAFALGTAGIHRGEPTDACVKTAIESFHSDLTHNATHGVLFEASIDEIVAASGVAETLPKYAAANPFKGWDIQDVERRLPDHGRCIIDIGGKDTDGVLSVADVKYKQNLDARYRSSTIEEYQISWQFLHYPWAYGEVKGEPCYRMYLCLVTYKPKFSVELIPHEVHPETQQMWLASAKAKWARMADPDAQLEMSTRHKDGFGMCHYYKACFTYHLDEGLMSQDYVIVPDRRPVVDTTHQEPLRASECTSLPGTNLILDGIE